MTKQDIRKVLGRQKGRLIANYLRNTYYVGFMPKMVANFYDKYQRVPHNLHAAYNKFIYEISPFKDDLLLLVNTFGIGSLILFHSKEYVAKLSYKEQFDVIPNLPQKDNNGVLRVIS